MKTVQINLYEFSELNEKAKQKAINEHCEFLCTVEEIEEPNEQYVIESIEINEYLFYSDGKLANVTQYCGKHEKAGTVELKLGDDIYAVN